MRGTRPPLSWPRKAGAVIPCARGMKCACSVRPEFEQETAAVKTTRPAPKPGMRPCAASQIAKTLSETRLPRQNGDQKGDRDDVRGDDAPRHVTHGSEGMLFSGSLHRPPQADDLHALEIHEDDEPSSGRSPTSRSAKPPFEERRMRAPMVSPPKTRQMSAATTLKATSANLHEEAKNSLSRTCRRGRGSGRSRRAEEHSPPQLADLGHKIVHDDACCDHLGRLYRS